MLFIYIQVFIALTVVISLIIVITPLIRARKIGINPMGKNDGFSKISQMSSIFYYIWILIFLFYISNDKFRDYFRVFKVLSTDVSVIIGMIVSILGLIVEAMGIKELGANFRVKLPNEETTLINTGIYKFGRNPIVFGVFLYFIGGFLVFPNWLTFIVLIINFVVFDAKVKDEEKFLLARFGNDYEVYMQDVARYFSF